MEDLVVISLKSMLPMWISMVTVILVTWVRCWWHLSNVCSWYLFSKIVENGQIVTYLLYLSPTHFVSNNRHQHRFNRYETILKWIFSICFSFLMNRKIYDKLCICSNNGNCGFLTFTVLVNFIVFANI